MAITRKKTYPIATVQAERSGVRLEVNNQDSSTVLRLSGDEVKQLRKELKHAARAVEEIKVKELPF